MSWLSRRRWRREYDRGVRDVTLVQMLDAPDASEAFKLANYLAREVRHANELAGKTGVSLQWQDGYEAGVQETIATALRYGQLNTSCNPDLPKVG